MSPADSPQPDADLVAADVAPALPLPLRTGEGETDGYYGDGRTGWWFARLAPGAPRRWQWLDGSQ
jgi:hypothetical protein